MSGGFVVPIVGDGGTVLGWGRGDAPMAGAIFYRTTGTDIRFLRVVNGAVVEVGQEEKATILAQDALLAKEKEEAQQQAVLAAAAMEATLQASQEAREAKVQAIRAKYRTATRALCKEVGVTEVDVMTADQLETTVLPLLEDSDSNAKIKRNIKSVAHLVKLLLLTMALKEEDGHDALDRV